MRLTPSSQRTRRALTAIGMLLFFGSTGHAGQAVSDNSMGAEASVVENYSPEIEKVTGGAQRGPSLFHSLASLSIDAGRAVYFDDPATVQAIFCRVTGGSASHINGLLGTWDFTNSTYGSSHFYLLNPSGILFGPNAQLYLTGSFYASTADSFVFPGGVEFSATETAAPPLLTLDFPAGLRFRDNAAALTVQTPTLTTYGLQLSTAQALNLSGGQVTVEGGGTCYVPDGIIDLAAVGEAGTLTLDTDTPLADGTARGDITLTNAWINAQGGAGGLVRMHGDDITVEQQSYVQGGTAVVSSGTVFNPGQDIRIDATGTMTVSGGSQISANAHALTPSELRIKAGAVAVSGGSHVQALTTGSGRAGDVTIQATGTVTVDGNEAYVGSVALAGASGDCGTVTITARDITVRNDGEIKTQHAGTGHGGDIVLTASDTIAIDGSDTTINSDGDQTGSGDITLTADRITASNGAWFNANSSGVDGAGSIAFKADTLVEFKSGSSAQSAALATGPGASGDIAVETKTLTMTESSYFSTSTAGEGRGGNVAITATEGVTFDGVWSGIESGTHSTSTGQGGDVTITTPELTMSNRARITASTEGIGRSGTVAITTTGDLTLTGASSLQGATTGAGDAGQMNLTVGGTLHLHGNDTQITSHTQAGSSGRGGDIRIRAGAVTVEEGAFFNVDTFGSGDGGSLNADVAGAVVFDGLSSGMANNVNEGSSGTGGGITLNAKSLALRNGATLQANTYGNGNAGQITATVTDELLITGANSNAQCAVATTAVANGGNLQLTAGTMTFSDSALINTTTLGAGNAGNITLVAHEGITIAGAQVDCAVDVLATSGQGGNVTVTAPNLTMSSGGRIGASTYGNGNAGSIAVDVGNLSMTDLYTSIDCQVGPESTGDGGNIAVTTGALDMRQEALITTTSFSAGAGGTIDIQASKVKVASKAQITATGYSSGQAGNIGVTASQVELKDGGRLHANTGGGQGNIRVMANQDLILRNASSITTNATGTATGGNITLETGNLVALENSDISANAQAAAGGQVVIEARGVFGTAYREEATGESDITATSELGAQFSGTVEIRTPETDPGAALMALPDGLINTDRLVPQTRCPYVDGSSYTQTGKTGMPPSPGTQGQSGSATEVALITPVQTVPAPPPSASAKTTTRPAPTRGWQRNPQGHLVLLP